MLTTYRFGYDGISDLAGFLVSALFGYRFGLVLVINEYESNDLVSVFISGLG